MQSKSSDSISRLSSDTGKPRSVAELTNAVCVLAAELQNLRTTMGAELLSLRSTVDCLNIKLAFQDNKSSALGDFEEIDYNLLVEFLHSAEMQVLVSREANTHGFTLGAIRDLFDDDDNENDAGNLELEFERFRRISSNVRGRKNVQRQKFLDFIWGVWKGLPCNLDKCDAPHMPWSIHGSFRDFLDNFAKTVLQCLFGVDAVKSDGRVPFEHFDTTFLPDPDEFILSVEGML